MEYYVALDGNDRWTGRLPEPNQQRTDGPFATLRQARDAVRETKAKDGLKEPITVMVRGEKYYLQETFVFSAQDSGARGCPVTYAAYPGEKPVVSGGRKLTGWKHYKDNILKCELPDTKSGKWKYRQLFFNGKRQTRARWPKAEPDNPIYGGWALMEGPVAPGSITAFRYKPGTFRRPWRKPEEIEVNYYGWNGWGMSTVPLKTIDYENRVITLAHGGWQADMSPWFVPTPFRPDNRFFVENALEELDQPGEWCFDSEDGIFYFWPPGELDENSEIIIPALDCLIDIQGAGHINITGLAFTETADGDNFHREGADGYGFMFPRVGWRYCGEAVRLKEAQYCVIANNHFYAVGGNAVYLEGYNARNEICHNEISYAGANGVCLLGSRRKHPVFNRIADNHIHHGGVVNKFAAGVFTGMSDGNIIANNLIEYMPHHAINLSNSPHGRNIVERNRIRHVCQETADNGAINCWMEEAAEREAERCGHVIRFNYISDCCGCEVSEGKIGPVRGNVVCGIYLDNLTSNCFVYGNIIARCGFAGIVVHAGKNNLIENNVIIDCQFNISLQDAVSVLEYWQGMAGFMTGNYILRNIFYQSQPEAQVFLLKRWNDKTIAVSDYNLFFQAGKGEYPLQHEHPDSEPIRSLAQWQEKNYDAHSIIGDPLFINFEDYRLSPESPAFRLGFQPIDVAEIGIRKKEKMGLPQNLWVDCWKEFTTETRKHGAEIA